MTTDKKHLQTEYMSAWVRSGEAISLLTNALSLLAGVDKLYDIDPDKAGVLLLGLEAGFGEELTEEFVKECGAIRTLAKKMELELRTRKEDWRAMAELGRFSGQTVQ